MDLKFLYLLILFDLPTQTKAQRKRYTKFRKTLLDDGFTMIQYSCYMRICKSNYSAQSHKKFIVDNLPKKGEVRIMKLTDNVYNSMKIYSSENKNKNNKTNQEKLGIQSIIEF
jgi:CRISPR-associated protein Cas2